MLRLKCSRLDVEIAAILTSHHLRTVGRGISTAAALQAWATRATGFSPMHRLTHASENPCSIEVLQKSPTFGRGSVLFASLHISIVRTSVRISLQRPAHSPAIRAAFEKPITAHTKSTKHKLAKEFLLIIDAGMYVSTRGAISRLDFEI